MNSNKSEIYGLTRFKLQMHAVEIPEQVHVICVSVLNRES